MDSYHIPRSKRKKGLQEDPQPLEKSGEPWRIRTSEPLIKSFKSTIQEEKPAPPIESNPLDFLRKRFGTVR